ncbi:MAG: pyridoxamine 5'-phosphate oxidase family protein [Pacificimonas sp.]|jgi:general stress protein 26|nr:pyridoxamine 5'-phosphate oxidase family protein [Pacificimonas sp.]
MTTDIDFKKKFWSELEDSPFVMLALSGSDRSHSQPMTAQFDDDYCNDLYFFTSSDNGFVKGLQSGSTDAVVSYSAKGHDFFASIHGRLVIDNDRTKIDKFWSPMVSAWFDGGKDDPKVTLLRMDLGRAEFWEAGTGSFLKEMASTLWNDTASEEAREHQTETRFAA